MRSSSTAWPACRRRRGPSAGRSWRRSTAATSTSDLPSAQIAVMGPEPAVNAVFFNRLAGLPEEERAERRKELEEEYRRDIDLRSALGPDRGDGAGARGECGLLQPPGRPAGGGEGRAPEGAGGGVPPRHRPQICPRPRSR